ncbi:Multimodular transpeptidase-transglycosylase [hydrothermal vent metagenome]|uniref:peptidoglycan glycosyltransferase n=1 Tax=hydrothermal vent metagenome TaxID=652676 RepID=A0A3B0ULR5_9ZZZZ
MPKPTRIIKWRTRRQRRRQRGGLNIFRWVTVLLLGLTTAVFTFMLLGVLGVTAVFASFSRDLPNFTELEQLGQDSDTTFETSKIYAWGNPNADGQRDLTLIYEIIDPLGGDRQWLPLDQIPQQAIDATIAIEDRTFWTNQGFDLIGIGRAFNEYVLQGGDIQGGSSITQQVVKNNLIAPERRIVGADVGLDDYQRKLEELLLAQQVSESYTKEQVLEWYLNSNFYGNLAYGIEAAARVYFDKPAAELTLAEAAMLAAIPQSPALNPINNPEAAKARQELVLDGMVREGMISEETAVSTKQLPVTVVNSITDRFDIIAPHFALYVQAQLEEMFGPELVLGGGLRVYTSLDLATQQQAECVARAHVNRLSGTIGPGLPADEQSSCTALDFLPPLAASDEGIDRNVSNAAVIMLDPQTAEIKAMVGSLNYWDASIDGSFNVAVDGLRQPGSAFKPFTYLTALSQGYSAASMVLDVETDFSAANNGIPYVPQNYDRDFQGPIRLRQALGSSYNIPAVQVMSWVGVNKVLRTAHSMGIDSLNQGTSSYGLSLTLGGGEVTLLDMTYAFSVMDNMGAMVGQPRPADQIRPGYRSLDPVAILRVEDRNGNLLYEYSQPQRREILTPQLAYIMNDMLSDRSARCAAFGCPNVLELPGNRPAAAKTGTTNDFRDGWTVGYTPQLVTGVWVGNSDNSTMQNVPGSKGAAPIWNALMSWALQDEPLEGWTRPSGIVERAVCNLSGLLPTSFCPTVSEIFIDGTQPAIFDNLYQEFAINRETGRLATIYTPPELVDRELFIIYPQAAADWVRENEIPQPPDEYDTIPAPDSPDDNIRISSPTPFAYARGQLVITGTARSDNFSFYRLAYFAGLTPINLQSLTDEVREPKENEALAVWDVSELEGLYTLLLTVVQEDGRFEEYSVQVTIDNTPPTAEILFPLPNQQIFTDEEWVIVQAQVADDISLDRVEFYVDGAGVPFAISTVPPFTEKWDIPGPGCHSFRVVAFDAAGNESSGGETAVTVCLIERE